jgi:hypothetical protein
VAERDALLADLDAAHEVFHELLARVDAELVAVPGVMEDWSVRDIVHHLAVWCDHGSEAIDLATSGRGAEFAYSTTDTDAMNERFLAEGRDVSPNEALRREARAFARFREQIAALDPALVGQRLGNGDTVEEVIVYDGPEHYAEHTEHLRAWFGEEPTDDEDD